MSDAPLVVSSPQAVATLDRASQSVASMAQLLHLAVERGTPVAELRELVQLHKEMQLQQAQQDFAQAMAAFQRECPPIKKSSTANFATRQGGKMSYNFAELDEIAQTVNPILARHGLSYTWDATVAAGVLTCVCTVRHAAGWSMTSTITLPTDSASAMSSQQKLGSAYTFARRLSLTAAFGLTTTDDDIDGRDTDGGGACITDDQANHLDALLTESKRDRAAFLRWLGAPTLHEIAASKYAAAELRLQRLIEKNAAEA